MIETGEGGNRESQVEPGHRHEPVKLSNSAAVAGVNLFWREVSLERENLLRAWERRSLFRLADFLWEESLHEVLDVKGLVDFDPALHPFVPDGGVQKPGEHAGVLHLENLVQLGHHARADLQVGAGEEEVIHVRGHEENGPPFHELVQAWIRLAAGEADLGELA